MDIHRNILCCWLSAFLLFGSVFIVQTAHSQVDYIRNDGQWDDHIKFKAELGGGYAFVEADRLTYVMSEAEKIHLHELDEGIHHTESEVFGSFAFSAVFEDAKTPSSIVGELKRSNYHNYYTSADAAQWRSHVPVFGAVRYTEIYEDIDLRLHSNTNLMEWDFIVHPGALVADIGIRYEGVESVEIVNEQLYLRTPLGPVVELAPVVYQETPNGREQVRARYTLQGKTVGFEILESYDESKELIIDPVLVFSTYTGSASDNWGFSATYDQDGFLYAAGMVSGFGYPTTIGAYDTVYAGGVGFVQTDIAISKFSPDGTQLIYSTYLGGTLNEIPHSLIVNDQNELIVYGSTGSSDFPVTVDAFDNSFNGGSNVTTAANIGYPNGSDIILTKFNVNGTNLIGSTYFGGSGNDGINVTGNNSLEYNYGDFARGDVIISPDGSILISSCTFSSDIPGTAGRVQPVSDVGMSGLIAKFNNDLSDLNWATYFGGNGSDGAYSIELNGDEIVIGGGTSSSDLAGMTGLQTASSGGQADGYLVILNDDASQVLHGTYLGTNAYDQVYLIELDDRGNVFAYGQTLGAWPVTDNVFNVQNGSQFIQKLDPSLENSIFSTVFGSPETSAANKNINISPTAFLVDICQNVYAIGWGGAVNIGFNGNVTSTNDMEVTDDAFQSSTDGSDFYLIVLEQDATDLLYATYFGEQGGRGDHLDGGTSRFDKDGFVYHAACASCGPTNGFPTTPGAWSENNLSPNCNLGAFKIEFDFAPIRANTEADPISGCPPLEVQFSNISNFPGEYYSWDFGDGTTSDEENPFHIFTDIGTYDVEFIIIDSNNCLIADTTTIQVIVTDSLSETIADFEIPDSNCRVDELFFTNTSQNANEFLWDFGDGSSSDQENPGHTYLDNGTYTVTLIADPGSACGDTITKEVSVFNSELTANFTFTQPDCQSTLPEVDFTDLSTSNAPVAAYFWEFGDGNSSTDPSPSHTYAEAGSYDVNLTITDIFGCSDVFSQNIGVSTAVFEAGFDLIPNCNPTIFGIEFIDTSGLSGTNVVSWSWLFGDGNGATVENPVHFYLNEGTYTVTLSVTNDLGCTATTTQEIEVVTEDIGLGFSIDSLVCNDPVTVFTNNTLLPDSVVSWEWDFGDGNVSNEFSPTHTYSTTGFYTVTLTATTSSGCISVTQDFFGHPLLDVDYDIFLPGGCNNVNQPVSFNVFGSTSSSVASSSWDFGDGNTQEGILNTSHIYTAPGAYESQFVITNAEGCVDTTTYPIIIRDTILIFPEANVEACGADLIVDFNFDLSTEDSMQSVSWDFGDGNVESVDFSPSHIYADTGTYTVSVLLGSVDGCIATNTFEVEVQTEVIDVSFSSEPQSCNSTIVSFENTSVLDSNDVDWFWDFGDGGTSSAIDTIYQYDTFGNYNAQLIGVTASGCADTFSLNLVLEELNTFLAEGLDICSGESVTLPLTSNFGTSFVWEPAGLLNDNSIQQPQASPTEDTWFTVVVSETIDGVLCSATDSVLVTVNELPAVTASAEPLEVPPGATVNLTATSNATSFEWSPEGLVEDANEASTIAEVNSTTTFQVDVVDANGCRNMDTITIVVTDDACALESLFIPNAFSPNGDGLNDVFRVFLEGEYDQFNIRIRDRWGNLVFETDDVGESWDGLFDGRIMATDAFGYVLEISCDGERIVRQGSVTLVR